MQPHHPSSDVRRFTLGEGDYVACSARCKKVTKFAYMLKTQPEQNVLCAFETLIRKAQKTQKLDTIKSKVNIPRMNTGSSVRNMQHQSLQRYSQPSVKLAPQLQIKRGYTTRDLDYEEENK